MKPHALMSGLLVLLLALGSPALADDDAKVKKDLGTVLALQGKSCGKVTKADKKGENDYVVTCETGDRYRINIDENERVVIKKL